MITIYLNGEKREISADTDLVALLELFSLPVQRVAIDVNAEVVKRSDWPKTKVHDGDRLEIVHFVGGG